jgi:3-mercaptopropionate dioxygenase
MAGELANLIAGIDDDFELPAAKLPHAVWRRLQDAVCPALFLDAARRLLVQLVSKPEAQYLHADPTARYAVEMFCWPPGFGNQPHLHRSWNASAVMAGALQIFRSSVSEAECLVAEPLVATAGQVGILTPPQFHCLRNTGTTTAVTLHVFSADESSGDIVHPEHRPPLSARFDGGDLLAIAAEAVACGGTEARDIVLSTFAVVENDVKLALMKLMATLDPAAAAVLARELATLVGGLDERRLLAIADQLEAHVGE